MIIKIIFLVFLPLIILSQELKTQSNELFDSEKWVPSIIGIERKCHSNKSRNTIGTAILLEMENKFYLITAKHVVEDIYKKEISDTLCILSSSNDYVIFNLCLNELSKKDYIFSENGIDIAIISLNSSSNGTYWRQTLKLNGNKAININDIYHEQSFRVHDTVYAIGIPSGISLNLGKHKTRRYLVFTPAGIQSTIAPSLDTNYFYVNSFFQQGISGGPIIKNNKLIGIIHGNSCNDKYLNNKWIYKDCKGMGYSSVIILKLLEHFK